MEVAEVLNIMRLLADGFDPETQSRVSADSVLQQPQVVRALCSAVQELEKSGALPERLAQVSVGRSWSDEEDAMLREEFRKYEDFSVIAQRHGRTRGAVVSRLVKLRQIKPRTPSSDAA